ncbi:MAG TPA: 3-hydroxylacyl-ACP dehydratase [Burkholderiales bacterium]|nr:3-hydroxylacyl-ACP dehydratase [Burkholderiales bacterium]
MSGRHYPAITELVPHRASMLLIDKLLECDQDGGRALHEVAPNAWYIERGGMPAWIGLELMAQTIAAFVGFNKRLDGLPPTQGYLLGTRRLRCAVCAFPVGARLEIVAKRLYQEDTGLAAFECEIVLDGAGVAHATLTVFEPHADN